MVSPLKIKLINTKEKDDRTSSFNEHISHASITHSLPFYSSRRGEYVHVVRSATAIYFDNEYQHTSYRLWCGQIGSMPGKGILTSNNDQSPYCATCIGKAIGAGVFDERFINGLPVMYRPKEQEKDDEIDSIQGVGREGWNYGN